MVWPGFTKPIKIGDSLRGDKDEFDSPSSYEEQRRGQAGRFFRPRARGWTGNSWPGKHVGQPQNEIGGKIYSINFFY